MFPIYKSLLRYVVFASIVGYSTLTAGCRKSSDSSTVHTSPTSGMDGTRIWTGNHNESFSPTFAPYWDTFYTYPDTAFAVTVIATNTVSVFGSTFDFDHADDSAGVRYFGSIYDYYRYWEGKGVAYFYRNDSIAIIFGLNSHNGHNIDTYHTR